MQEGYRIVIHVFRGTSAGRALQMMANGVQVEAPTLEKAAVLVEEFLDAAEVVLGAVDAGISFGVISVGT